MIDVGRKIVSHQIRGFLAAQTVYYLVNFNLSPRQIWITRHGESIDNVNGKIGGNSGLSENGQRYAQALTRFVEHQRKEWATRQQDKVASTHFPPRPGDTTPPNPEYTTGSTGQGSEKNFCIWTSMLRRSIETAQYFDEEEFDVKQMKMLDELNAGDMEGMTYEEIRSKHADEYELRRGDKLHYRYPGAGGEGYLDIINRLRAVIVEVERMIDHVLLVGHRSVARVLLAYFIGLKREDVADLDVPLGILYMLEPVSCHVHPSLIPTDSDSHRNRTASTSKPFATAPTTTGSTTSPNTLFGEQPPTQTESPSLSHHCIFSLVQPTLSQRQSSLGVPLLGFSLHPVVVLCIPCHWPCMCTMALGSELLAWGRNELRQHHSWWRTDHHERVLYKASSESLEMAPSAWAVSPAGDGHVFVHLIFMIVL